MRFNLSFLLFFGIIFIVTQSFQCENKPKNDPGVNIIHVTVVDENNMPVPFATIGLFRLPIDGLIETDCLVDTFFTQVDGTTTYSFLNTDKNFFAVQVLPHQLAASNRFIFDDIGEHETVLQTTHAQSLINLHFNAAPFDSTVVISNPPEHLGVSCVNSLILIPQYLDKKGVNDNTTDHQISILGIPNKTNILSVSNYSNGIPSDSTIYVQLDSTIVNIEIN